MTIISGWHAHIYFDEETRDDAIEHRNAMSRAFAHLVGVRVGKLHDKPIGPHTKPMYQIVVPVEHFSKIISIIAICRFNLTVLFHPETGDEVADHISHAIWMGNILPINLEGL